MLKKVLIGLLAVIIVIVGCALAYKVTNSQGVIDAYSVNTGVEHPMILIATQKSEFKNAITQKVVQAYEGRPVHIDIVDVTQLSNVTNKEWDGIVIVTAVEAGTIPKAASEFLASRREKQHPYILVTAGAGEWKDKPLHIDAKSTASVKEKSSEYAAEIIDVIDKLIAEKK